MTPRQVPGLNDNPMDAITFGLSYAMIWLLSRLPIRMVYSFSDFLFLVIYYLARYRRKIVFMNLSRAFPDKDPAEISRLAKKFYHFFCDVSLEIFVSQRWSYEKIGENYKVRNPEIVDNYIKQNRNIMIIAGHHGNWEWTRSFTAVCNIHIIAVYKPLSNKYFNRWVVRVREDENHTVVPMDQSFRTMLDFERRKVPYLSYLVADQRPLPLQIHRWINFLNQDTPVFSGPEKIAVKTGQAVIFLKVHRAKRGFYDVDLIPIIDNPAGTAENEITDSYFRMLEEMIREQPELYLWSHNRWKFTREDVPGH